MIKTRIAFSTLLVLVVLSACGGGASLIDTPAADMNLAASGLGDGWEQLGADMGVADMPSADLPHVDDFNMRMFTNASINGMAITMVFRIQDIASAEQEMQSGAVGDIAQELETQVPGASMQEFDPPNVGEDAMMIGGTHADTSLNIYVLAFREANVIGMLMLMGSDDAIDQDFAIQAARTMEGTIQ